MSSFLQKRADRSGFTLIELLLVIGIIAILAAIVIVAINPTKQLGDARNAQRRSDVNSILSAVYQWSIDNNGNLPGGTTNIETTEAYVCQDSVTPTDCDTLGFVNLRMLSGRYLVNIPRDPQLAETGTGTRYSIVRDSNSRVTVRANAAEQGVVISVTR